jgi:hypothetical protein
MPRPTTHNRGTRLAMADPDLAFYVESNEALRLRNEALLERVTKLERALETIADPDWASVYPYETFKETKRIARKALDG